MPIKMPVMNGFEATQEIKKYRSDLPVVAQTAFAAKDDRQKALDAGCDGYISKPIHEDSFYKILARFLKRGESN